MKESTEQVYRQRILRVQMYIQENLDRDLPLEELARESYFSEYHFHRIFRAVVGEPLKEYIRRLRLERAVSHLKHTNNSIINIAFDAGYQTHEAFTRAFKAIFGCSPSGFRSGNGMVVQHQSDASMRELNPAKGDHPMKVEIKTIGKMHVAFVRHVGPYDQVGKTWDRLCMHLGKAGCLGAGSRFVGICYDDPDVTAPEKIRYDACVTVDEDFEPEGDIAIQTIGGGEYAVTTHFGPYKKLGQTYTKLFRQWLLQSNRELRSEPCMEFYLNDPEGTEPEDLLTDVCLPLKPK